MRLWRLRRLPVKTEECSGSLGALGLVDCEEEGVRGWGDC